MGFVQRKMLRKSMEMIVVIKQSCIDHCYHFSTTSSPPLPPPPPPPPPRSFNQSLSPFLIIMFCGLAVSICFICYLTCATRYRRRNNHNTNQETHEDYIVNEDLGPVIHNPIWLINTIGLDRSLIEKIHVFKYKRDEKVIEGTDCSVCLSEFEDDETLRLLPKCSHAFHVACIDAWLRSHTNCPLCRAPIFKNTNDRTHEQALTDSNLIESSSTLEETETLSVLVTVTGTETTVGCETIGDHQVVEVENSVEIGKSLYDHDHVQGKELVTMRRSFSNSMLKSENKLNESSSSLNICQKVMKSSSVGRSLRKAGSFTSKYRPGNRSY